MKQYIFRDGATFSRHTDIPGLAELVFDGLMRDAESEEEQADIVTDYGNGGEEVDRYLIEEIYSYEILEPTPELIAEWEAYHDTKWDHEEDDGETVYAVQSWNVAFDFRNACVLNVNIYIEGETMLTYDELRMDAIGQAEELGIRIGDTEHTTITALQLEEEK